MLSRAEQSITWHQYQQLDRNKDNIRLIGDLDSNVLDGVVSKYVIDNIDLLVSYINKLNKGTSESVSYKIVDSFSKGVFNIANASSFLQKREEVEHHII